MTDAKIPVTVGVTRPDGSVEQVRVGWAVKHAGGFALQLGELTLGAPESAFSFSAAAAAGAEPPRRSSAGAPAGAVFPNYGRSKGAPIAGATVQDLEYYAAGARRSLADPSKSRFHDKERQLLTAIEAELSRRGDAPPPRSDDDAPPNFDDPF